ncbi:toll-like receptor 13 [Ptychodera flava]|uniref:toll-like receptor 13 n=1 Tax=Ptychodera flava TaxID=63121 RepID=UPI00396A4F70
MAVFCLILFLLLQCTEASTQQPVCKVYNDTHIDCSGRRLEDVPNELPVFASHLDMSSNNIKKTGSDSFKELNQLLLLNLSGNVIYSIHSKSFSQIVELEILDLHSNKLASIPEKLFSDLKNLKILILNSNSLIELFPTSFHGLGLLSRLYLDQNNISLLQDGIFNDSTQLRVISLAQNKLSCFPSAALKPLVFIREIMVKQNPFRENCPTVDLRVFPKLEKLTLAGWNDGNGKLQTQTLRRNGVRSPKAKILGNVTELHIDMNTMSEATLAERLLDLGHPDIKSLYIRGLYSCSHDSGRCKSTSLTNTSFETLQETRLEKLDISNRYIYSLPSGVFQWLKHLKTLSIEDSRFESLHSGVFHGIDNLNELTLTGNSLSNITDVSQRISDLHQLNYLNLRDNEFSGEIPAHVFAVPSLVELDLSRNSFSSIHPHAFTSLPNLKTLDLSDNGVCYRVDGVFSFLVSLQTLYLQGNDIGSWPAVSQTEIIKVHPLKGLTGLKLLFVTTEYPEMLHLEDVPSLEHLQISCPWTSIKSFYNMGFLSFEMLRKANLSMLNTINIKYANIFAATSFLDAVLSNSEPSYEDFLERDPVPWKYLKTLEIHEGSWMVNEQEFQELLKLFPNLEELSLTSLESFTTMDVPPNTLVHLRSLDISSNQITKINTHMLMSLPSLKYFDIRGNPLSCYGCEMRSFVQWYQNDKNVQLSGHIDCGFPVEMQGTPVLSLKFGLGCNLAFAISVPVTCIVVVTLATALGIRFRWHLRYLLFLWKKRRGCYKPPEKDEEQPLNKKYDAFVVYSEPDRAWVMQELIPNLENTDPPKFKLCIHERDFVQGIDIFDNILHSIDSSNKTLLVLSPHFAQSEWCYFEMRMAQQKLFEDKKDILLMVMLQEIPDNKMTRVIRKTLLTKRYLEWPENNLGREIFWHELEMALKADSRVNRIAYM